MFNVGVPEVVLILVAALLIFGPSKLPSIGRSIGQAFREFKKAGDELTRAVTDDPEPRPPAKPGDPS